MSNMCDIFNNVLDMLQIYMTNITRIFYLIFNNIFVQLNKNVICDVFLRKHVGTAWQICNYVVQS